MQQCLITPSILHLNARFGAWTFQISWVFPRLLFFCWKPLHPNICNWSACVLWIRIYNGSWVKELAQQRDNYTLFRHLTPKDRKVNFQFQVPKYVHCTVLVCTANIYVHFLQDNVKSHTVFSPAIRPQIQTSLMNWPVSSHDVEYCPAELDYQNLCLPLTWQAEKK